MTKEPCPRSAPILDLAPFFHLRWYFKKALHETKLGTDARQDGVEQRVIPLAVVARAFA